MSFRGMPSRLSDLVADVITGATIRTRLTGRRVQIDTSDDWATVQFFSGAANESTPALVSAFSDTGVSGIILRSNGMDPFPTSRAGIDLTTTHSDGRTRAYVVADDVLIATGAPDGTVKMIGPLVTANGTVLSRGDDTDWAALPLNAGWQANAGVRAPQYRRVAGETELRGWPQYAGGGTSFNLGALPPGFRPAAIEDFPVWVNSGSVMRVRVQPDGQMLLSAAIPTNVAFCFNRGVKFAADGA